MKISDSVYGDFALDEPALVELIETPAFQRLQHIAQWGIPDEYYQKNGFSRYEHSIGVMRLLQLVGASLEEQIAGLLHDVSHTAFSHVVDWVIGDGGDEGFQDANHEQVIRSSKEIVTVLEKYDLTVEKVVNYEQYPLLEKDAPDLCADRLDYVFREAAPSDVEGCLKSLTVHENEIVFSNHTAALLFAETFLNRQVSHWGSFNASVRYRLFGNVLREALDKKIIVFEDFWHTDDFVLEKLQASKDSTLLEKLRILREEDLYIFPKSGENIQKKFRWVDPKFVENGKVFRLTESDPDYKARLEFCREQSSKGIELPQAW